MGNRLRPEDCTSLANLGRFALQLARERLPDTKERMKGVVTRTTEVTLSLIVGGVIVLMAVGPELIAVGGLRYITRLQFRLERQEHRVGVIGELVRSERTAAGAAIPILSSAQ